MSHDLDSDDVPECMYCNEREEELATLRQQLEFQTKQGASRLIGLCKCGIERGELRQQVSDLQAREAQLVEALSDLNDHFKSIHSDHAEFSTIEQANLALSASTAPAWLAEHDAGVLEEAEEVCQKLEGNACGSGFASTFDAADAIRRLIEERKAK